MERKRIKLSTIVFSISIIAILLLFHHFWTKYNFNEYIKTEYKKGQTQFVRDRKIKYGKQDSYEIISNKDYNDAMFYKTIQVQPNTVYKITCKVKTEDVITKKENSTGGANICIVGTLQKSRSIVGTTDWQEIELLFDSKKETEMKIGFRLGENDDECIGKAWFTDFKIEIGARSNRDNWKFAMFIVDTIDLKIDNEKGSQRFQISLTNEEKALMQENFKRFGDSIEVMSNNQMEAELYTYEIKEPLTQISSDEKNGYYVEPKDIEKWIDSNVENQEFDHIFVVVKLGDINSQQLVPVNDWIGLGAMEYYGIGYSNIRLPNDQNSNIYRYNSTYNTFPEEVFVHEFLHSLERDLIDRGHTIPALHDSEKYGYLNQKVIGLQKWYTDYMRKQIKTEQGNFTGLDSIVYRMQPVQKSDFRYSYEGKQMKDPTNFIEELKALFTKTKFIFSNKE